jgi:hypothetical protein
MRQNHRTDENVCDRSGRLPVVFYTDSQFEKIGLAPNLDPRCCVGKLNVSPLDCLGVPQLISVNFIDSAGEQTDENSREGCNGSIVTLNTAAIVTTLS